MYKILKKLTVGLLFFFSRDLFAAARGPIELQEIVVHTAAESDEHLRRRVDRALAQGYTLEQILMSDDAITTPGLMCYLLELGANPRIGDATTKLTLLHHVAYAGFHTGVQLILGKLSADAKVSFVNEEGRDGGCRLALHYAVLGACDQLNASRPMDEFVGIVRELAITGRLINCEDGNGKTALHMAAAGGCEAIVQELLSLGADATLRTPQGKTAHTLAVEGGHEACAKLLAAQAASVPEECKRLVDAYDEEWRAWGGQ